jgi:hypothetical protein
MTHVTPHLASQPDRALAWAPACLAVLASLVVVAVAGMGPRDPHRVAAVFPPWWTFEQTMAAATRGDQTAIPGGAPFIALVFSGAESLPARLHASGAILLVDPGLVAFCGG